MYVTKNIGDDSISTNNSNTNERGDDTNNIPNSNTEQ